jgi:hypothetical protein
MPQTSGNQPFEGVEKKMNTGIGLVKAIELNFYQEMNYMPLRVMA